MNTLVLTLLSHLAGWTSTAIVAGLAAYYGSYLKKKGENFATKEDIALLVAQAEATTTATRAIEARIDDQFWNRQRVWEMKRDTLLGLLANIRDMDDSIAVVNETAARLKVIHADDITRRGAALEMQNEAKAKWSAAWKRFIARRTEASILCSPDIYNAANALSSSLVGYFRVAIAGDITDFASVGDTLRAVQQPLNVAIQRELGVVPTVA